MVADAFEVGTYRFFVGEGLVLVVVHVVGHLAGFGHLAYLHLDGRHAAGDFADELLAVGTEFFVLFGREGLAQAAEVFQQAVLVADSRGDDVVDSQVAEDAAFDLYLHGEFFQLYFEAAGQLGLVEDTFADENGACLVVDVVHQRFGYVADVGQAAAGSFLFPFFGVAVAFEADGLGSDDHFLEGAEDGFILGGAFFHGFVDRGLEFVQLVGHGGVDGNHGSGAVG